MFKLTCRSTIRAKPSEVQAVSGPDPLLSGRRRLVFFIHGFNNDERTASTNWATTIKKLEKIGVPTEQIVMFFWPGEHSDWQLYSAINYPRILPVALETARLLASYIKKSTAQLEYVPRITLVAHSLGALVALETLKILNEHKANVLIDTVLLMAAAVPEGFCVPPENYGELRAVQEIVLFSRDDWVLSYCFKVGQRLAKQFPSQRKRAVGLTGGPSAGYRPGRRWSENQHMDGFGHGDYWSKQEALDQIAEVILLEQHDILKIYATSKYVNPQRFSVRTAEVQLSDPPWPYAPPVYRAR